MRYDTISSLLVFLVLAVSFALTPTASGQTGPGGVGTDTGSSSLRLWLRPDTGVLTPSGTAASNGDEVQEWVDQSGYGNNVTAPRSGTYPSYVTNFLGAEPVLTFDGADVLTYSQTGSALNTLPDSDNTIIVVSKTSSSAQEQNVVNAGGGAQSRVVSYLSKNSDDVFVLNGKNFSNGSAVANGINISGFRILSSTYAGEDANALKSGGLDIIADGTVFADTQNGSNVNGGDLGIGNNAAESAPLNGQIAEVVIFDRDLSSAELRIVYNYLAAKYDLTSNLASPLFQYGDYSDDVAGIGRDDNTLGTAKSGVQTSSQSSILRFEKASFAADDNFALFGHDGAAASFSVSETPNNGTYTGTEVQKTSREWRVDLSGPSSMTLDKVAVDVSSLSLGASYNDYAIFIDSDGDFTSGAEFVDLEADGTLTNYYSASNVEIEDGDYVTVARINRQVELAPTNADVAENATAPQVSLTVSLNFPNTTSIDVPFTLNGDLDGSGQIEDGGFNASGSNDNGDFEADDGSGVDGSTGSEGNFEGDLRLNATSPLSISGTSATIDVEYDNDGLVEQTEKYEVSLGTPSGGAAELGADNTFAGQILDDDNPRDIIFSDTDYTDGTDNDPNYTPQSVEGSGGTTRIEQFTIQLDQDGDGETAATESPCTSALVFLRSGTEATVGTDLSDPATDFRFVDEQDPGGSGCSEYQVRESADEARVFFSSGAREATLKLEINEDDVEDDDFEDIALGITTTVSSSVSGSDQETLYQIEDDDSAPTATFAASNFSGSESSDASLSVELSAVAGTDLTVAFADAGTGTADPSGTPDDYDFPSSPATITIPAGSQTGTFTFTINDDSEPEVSETIDVNLDYASSDINEPSSGTKTATYTIIDNDGVGATGPGGVGRTDGTGNLVMWLRGDEGVGTSSGNVTSWTDQSGSGNSATAPGGNEPTTGTLNGVATVDFAAADSDYLNIPLSGFASADNSLFLAYNRTGTGSPQGIFEVVDGTVDDVAPPTRRIAYDGTNTSAFNGNGTGEASQTSSSPAVVSSFYTSSNTTVDISVNGAAAATSNTAESTGGTDAALGTRLEDTSNNSDITIGPDGNSYFDGQMGEVIVFNKELNTARRNIIANYLAAKYGITLTANNLYTGASNNYRRQVIGVGRDGPDSVEDSHRRAQSAGLSINVNSGLDDGEYLFVGDSTASPPQSINTSDVSGPADLTTRADGERFVTQVGQITVDIALDLTSFGLRGPAGSVGNYMLLYRSGTSGSWTSAGTASSASGNDVTFSSVTLPTDFEGEITIGTTNYVDSPLDTRYTALRGASGDEASSGGNGGDAGYVTLGLPAENTQAGELLAPDGSPIFTTTTLGLTGLNSDTKVLYTWDYANQFFVPVTDPTTVLDNGRGFYFWVKDDTNFPVDPEFTFGLPDTSSEPTSDVSVSVGDASGRYVFLANPYFNAFDMTAPGFTDLDANGFQNTIASWDPDNGGQYGSYVVKTQGLDDDEIARYQGFFLERSTNGAGATSFTFDYTGRVTGRIEQLVGAKSTSARAAQKSTVAYRRLGLKLSAMDGGEEVSRDVAANVVFVRDASAAWDAYDAPKYRPLTDRYATLAPVGNGRDGSATAKSQESRSYTPQQPISIPLEMKQKNLSGTFRLSVHQFEYIPDDWTIRLVDNRGTDRLSDDRQVELSKVGDAYEFTSVATSSKRSGPTPEGGEFSLRPEAMSAKSSRSGSRFTLRIDPKGQPLPVELSKLNASIDAQDVVVSWATASETNNAGFSVQHKAENGTYEDVGFVEGGGTSDGVQKYSFRVEDLTYGSHSFRLKQVDEDGTTSYSKAVSAKLRLDQAYDVGQPYPNPTRNRSTVEVTVREAQNVRVEMYDMLGRRIQVVCDERIKAQHTQRFEMTVRDLASGHYFVRVIGDDFVETRRLTVVR